MIKVVECLITQHYLYSVHALVVAERLFETYYMGKFGKSDDTTSFSSAYPHDYHERTFSVITNGA